jgi:hypothetical protein
MERERRGGRSLGRPADASRCGMVDFMQQVISVLEGLFDGGWVPFGFVVLVEKDGSDSLCKVLGAHKPAC